MVWQESLYWPSTICCQYICRTSVHCIASFLSSVYSLHQCSLHNDCAPDIAGSAVVTRAGAPKFSDVQLMRHVFESGSLHDRVANMRRPRQPWTSGGLWVLCWLCRMIAAMLTGAYSPTAKVIMPQRALRD